MTDEFESKKRLAGLIAKELSRFLPWQTVMPPYAPKNLEHVDESFDDEESGGGRASPPWLESEGGLPEFPIDSKAEKARRQEMFGEDDNSVSTVSETLSNTHKQRAEKKLKAKLQNRNKPAPRPMPMPRPGGGTYLGTSDDND